MRVSVRTFFSEATNCQRAVLFVGDSPSFWANAFVTARYLCAGKSPATVSNVLYAIGSMYDWAKERGIADLENRLLEGDFLSLLEAEDLAFFLRLKKAAQGSVHRKKSEPKKIIRLDQIRGDVSKRYEMVSAEHAARRCEWVAMYLTFLAERRPRQSRESERLVTSIETAIKRVRELAPSRPGLSEDESLEGLPRTLVEVIADALRPTSDLNPFSTEFHRHRNELMWRTLHDTGMRRGELKPLKVPNFDTSKCTVAIRESKTRARTVPISSYTAELFHHFVVNYWSKLPLAKRKKGYLFTTAAGDSLGLQAINLVFVEIRTKIPNVPNWLTPHTMRRTWNDSFSELIDAQPSDRRMTVEEETATRNRLQGWSSGSQMSARYARRYIRRKADEVAERLANSLKSDPHG